VKAVKTLNKAERNYCVTPPGLAAIVTILEHFHKYIYGQEFHLLTNHSVLTWLTSFKKLKEQTTHWILRLQEYNFTSEDRQGRKHNNADTLSRRPCREECIHCHKVEAMADVKQVRAISTVAAACWGPAALRTEQLNDQDIWPILEEVETGQRPEWKDIADRRPRYKSCWARSKSLTVRNSVLQRHWKSADRRSQIAQRVLPRSRLKDMLTELHGGPPGDHLGVNRNLNKFRQKY
jgi:hypothetical protein